MVATVVHIGFPLSAQASKKPRLEPQRTSKPSAANVQRVIREVTIQKSDKVHIGIQLKACPAPDTRVLVSKLVPDGRAAAAAQLALNDEIITVNGENVIGKSPQEIANCIINASKRMEPLQMRIVREKYQRITIKRKRSAKGPGGGCGDGVSLVRPSRANSPLVVSGIKFLECPSAHHLPVGTSVDSINGKSTSDMSVLEAIALLSSCESAELRLDHRDLKELGIDMSQLLRSDVRNVEINL